MDWAQIHILINHFPVILAATGALAVLLGFVRGRRGVWLYATISLALAALTVLPTYFTGAPAEKTLNDPWYIPKGVIHSHEQSAQIAAVLTVLAGLLAVYAWRRLVRYPREVQLPNGLRVVLAVSSLAAAIAIGYTSLLGGRIVHDAPALHGPAPAGMEQPTPASSGSPGSPGSPATPAATTKPF
jgi:uncharacterized membrane protein